MSQEVEMFVSERAQSKTSMLTQNAQQKVTSKIILWGQQDGSGVKKIAAKPDNLSSIPRAHKVEENQLQVVPNLHICTMTHL